MRNDRPRSNIVVMAVTSGLNVGAMMMWAPVLSLHLRDLGATDLIIGVATASWLLLAAAGQFAGGRLSDRLGRVPTISWPGIIQAVAIILCSLAPSWPSFVVLYAMYYGGHAIQGPVFSSVVGESVPPAERGRAFGRVELAIGVGVISGPLAGSVLMPVLGIRWLLAISGVLFALAAVLRLTLLVETKPMTTGAASFAYQQVLRPPLASVLAVLVGFNSLLALTLWGPFISLHASDAMGLSRPAINQLAAAGSAFGILMSIVAGHAVSRWGFVPVLRVGLPGLAGLAVVWSLQRAVPAIVGTYMLMYAAFQLAMISSDTFKISALPDEIRGRALGAIGMSSSLLTAPMVPLASWLRSAWGSGAPFAVALIPATIGLVSLTIWQRQQAAIAMVPLTPTGEAPGEYAAKGEPVPSGRSQVTDDGGRSTWQQT